MSFKIENVGNLERQNIVDGNIKIGIGSINTNSGREKLSAFLKKVYDADSNDILDSKELRRLREEYGKEITEEKLNAVEKNFFGKEKSLSGIKLTPVMKKAMEAIEKKLYNKMVYYSVSKKNGKKYCGIQNLSKYAAKCENPAELRKISEYYEKLRTIIMRFASRSDINAKMILSILNNDKLCFAFNADSAALALMKENCAGLYNPKYDNKRVILITSDVLNAKDLVIQQEDVLAHECVHALDHAKRCSEAYVEKLYPLLIKDMGIIDNIVHNEEYSAGVAGDLITGKTWFWFEADRGRVGLPFIHYMAKAAQRTKSFGFIPKKYAVHLLLEYVAYATQFYLSADMSKRERLKHHNPKLYNFIEKEFLPTLVK